MGAWFRRLGYLLRQSRHDAELREEIEIHRSLHAADLEREGLTPRQAAEASKRAIGSVLLAREDARRVWLGSWDVWRQDLRYGLRSLRRHAGFSAMAVVSLAIGIGANAAIFAVARAVLFPSSPVRDPGTLVNIYESEANRGFGPMSYPNIEDLRRGTRDVFSGIAASTVAVTQLDEGGGSPGLLVGEAVSGGAFSILGVEPGLGRAIQAEDDVTRGGHPVVMLSYSYWRRAFGADPQVLGRTLRMGGRDYTIIGVAPANYRGGLPAFTPAFYVPLAMQDEIMGAQVLDRRNFHNFAVRARIAPGVTRAQAQHAASLVAASLDDARPEGWRVGEQFQFMPTSDVHVTPGVDPILRAASWLQIAVGGLVLLLACTNLASFLLARALDRGHEVAVRRALGATRGTLARQVLVESALLGLGGAAAGLALAVLLINLLLSIDLPLPFGMRLDLHLGLDWKVLFHWKALLFTAAAGVLAGGLLGLVPAIQGTRPDAGSALTTGSRGTEAPGSLRWRNVLIVAQITMSLVLLVGAGLFLRSWQRTLAVDPGFGRAPTSIMSVLIPVTTLTPDAAVQRTRRLLERFRTLPGVESAGLIWPIPLDVSDSFTEFNIDGRVPPPGRQSFRAERATVDGGFFDTAGIAIVDGRTFNDGDRRDGQHVAVISKAMARRYWPGGDALGRILRRHESFQPDLVIVGVASDINMRSLGEAPRDVVYEFYAQGDVLPGLTFLVRTATDPERMAPALIAAGREVAPDLRVMQTTTMRQHLAMSRLPSQVGAVLLAAFATLGMALAAVGVYGMVRYAVAMRTREVGIRMALGADAAGVVRLLAMHALRLVLTGVTIGAVASLLAARFLSTLLFGVGAFDPVALAGAPIVLGAAAWLAAYLPARRASRVDPLTALRAD